MSPAHLSNYGPGRGPAQILNGSGWPENQIIRAFSGLGWAEPGGPNVHLYSSLGTRHCLMHARQSGAPQAGASLTCPVFI
jgi:hypothetical protein